MTDWHSHVLPAIDDGAKDVQESLKMLGMLSEQGVDTVCATPHFYANSTSVERFLANRERAAASLKEHLPDGSPEILLGAEVKYYPGIGRMERLDALCLEGSRLLLLEMPFGKWTEYTLRELSELSSRTDVRIMLAHIDRYLKLQSGDVWRRVYESGILMQVNASFITGFFTKRQAMSMLCERAIHFIGSDCHNTTTRAPNIGVAYSVIEKKLGTECLDDLEDFGEKMRLAR